MLTFLSLRFAKEAGESIVDAFGDLLECRPRQRKEHAVPVVIRQIVGETKRKTFRITARAAFPPLGFLSG